jgi:hypothetical protein
LGVLAGCARPGANDSSDDDTETGGDPDAPTWHRDIAPLVHAKCLGCHRDQGIAPFSMQTYDTASPWAELMAEHTASRYMPPFLARDTDECAPPHPWQDDLRLSDDQIALIGAWAAAGAPEGDPDTAAELPEPPSLELEDPDLRVAAPQPVDIQGPGDRFLCFSLDPGLTEDQWLQAMQIEAGNPEIVHHVLVYLDEAGESAAMANEDGWYECFGDPGIDEVSLLGAWAPGSVPVTTPPGVAMRVPAGSRLVMNVHYHPSTMDVETDPGTAVQLRWFEGYPQYAGELLLIGNGVGLQPGPNDENGTEFRIPAGVKDHTETMLYPLPPGTPDLTVWSVGTHMHYVGRDMIIGVAWDEPPPGGPASQCLIQTPAWDFNWQRQYVYDAPLDELPVASVGDVIALRCTYDNTLDNRFVVQALEQQGLDEPHDVVLGESTLDEMCLGVFGIATKLLP